MLFKVSWIEIIPPLQVIPKPLIIYVCVFIAINTNIVSMPGIISMWTELFLKLFTFALNVWCTL